MGVREDFLLFTSKIIDISFFLWHGEGICKQIKGSATTLFQWLTGYGKEFVYETVEGNVVFLKRCMACLHHIDRG